MSTKACGCVCRCEFKKLDTLKNLAKDEPTFKDLVDYLIPSKKENCEWFINDTTVYFGEFRFRITTYAKTIAIYKNSELLGYFEVTDAFKTELAKTIKF